MLISGPHLDENRAILDKVKELIVKHEDNVQECSCDYDEGDNCWYRLTDEEQRDELLVYLIGSLEDMRVAG